MAVDDSRIATHPSWKDNSTTHSQCLEKLLKSMETGKIDLSGEITGLPLRPKMDGFDWDFLSKRTGSNPTYKVTYGKVSFVVRMKPPGEKNQGLFGICLEYKVLSYVHKMGLPVPKPYYLEPREDVIGTEFFIMECVDENGIIFSDHSLLDLEPDQRRTVYYSMTETLARLHRLPLGELELLLDPDKVFDDAAEFWKWQLMMWEQNVKAASPLDHHRIQELLRTMKGLSPPQARAKCLLHHDFNLDNIVIDKETCKVKAVLDWESCCAGDPVVDLAQSCIPFVPVPVERLGENTELAEVVANPEVPGIPTMAELVAHYRQCTGVDFSECDLNYALTVICLRFIPVFLDSSDDNDHCEATRRNRKEVVEFLTETGCYYCPGN